MQCDDYFMMQKEREEAENFVYSCLLDIMRSKNDSKKASHSYYMSEAEFIKYFNIAPTINLIADEEHLNVEFKVTDKNEHIVIVSRKWEKGDFVAFFVAKEKCLLIINSSNTWRIKWKE